MGAWFVVCVVVAVVAVLTWGAVQWMRAVLSGIGWGGEE